MTQTHDMPPDVAAAYGAMPDSHRQTLLDLRDMVLAAANTDPRVGQVTEALRWGEPAYLTQHTKSGSTIRLGIEKGSGLPAIFLNCNTTLVEDFRQQFGTALRYSKNRAVLVDGLDKPKTEALSMCIAAALTYHLRK